ncbi:hypothetical protein H480_25468 [Amycolatopsis vancoresmycina DSM 44592]|uniref:Ig-like domain-containing protein n=1 Tax=Amycolatopsis vancoresmycina DSM 44592 TaxID=1292037 RepID=R1HZD0_9PSEU|nr:hypothetical protein H480_25468 [Amycolatopsis vancoresmycina DSM 44592]
MVFAAVLVAASWTTVISGLVAVGAAKAEAAWLKSGAGTASAAALPLKAPDTPTTSNVKCNRSGGTDPTATVTWTYPSTFLPPKFEVLSSTTPNNASPAVAATTTALSATIPLPGNNQAAYLSVRSVAGTWRLRSGEVRVC